MALGTAGYTAMLCVMRCSSQGVTPDQRPVLVTGANGGVGTIAIALLSRLGYTVHASTGRHERGRPPQGAGRQRTGRPRHAQRPRQAAAEGALGRRGGQRGQPHPGQRLRQPASYGGAVAACGLAQGMDFPASMAPFILRGVTLAGVDSVMAPHARRVQAWQRLASRTARRGAGAATPETIGAGRRARRGGSNCWPGQVRGRVVVDVNA
jgi:acrylyl-CoA reductase (NADPH)